MCETNLPALKNKEEKVMSTKQNHSFLLQMVEKLGGCVTDNPRQCTHLVAKSLCRTVKFFIAINVCKYIVNKDWLEDSITKDKFLGKFQLL